MGIKRKVVKLTKTIAPSSMERWLLQALELKQKLKAADKNSLQIIFADEAMFTYSTLPRLAYCSKGSNICVNERAASAPALAVVGAVSRENGLLAWHLVERSINSESFIAFLNKLSTVVNVKESVLLLDNCRVHHSKLVKKHLQELGLQTVFNVAYSPQFNPIERVWAMVKLSFKKSKLKALQRGIKVNYKELVKVAMSSVDREAIKQVCSRVFQNTIMKIGEAEV